MLFKQGQPTLIIDKDKVLANIEHFANLAKKQNIVFRPHFKTHQSKEIGKWFHQYGINQITVSSVSMAQYFADANWHDILIAFPLNLHELNQVKKLAQKINLHLTVSSMAQVMALINAGIKQVKIYIKIDTGYGRSGIETFKTNEILAILEQLKNHKISFVGFLTHFGHTCHVSDFQDIESIYKNEVGALNELKAHLATKNYKSIISVGDTPGLSQIKDFSGIDEIRPGNFIFFDCMQENLGACHYKDIAVALACPVVEINKTQQKLVLYGGAVHLSKDHIVKNDQPYFGAVVRFQEKGWSDPDDEIFVKSLSQEHGIVHCPREKIDEFNVGDILGILPVHSCLTANLMKGYFDFKGNKIDHLNRFI